MTHFQFSQWDLIALIFLKMLCVHFNLSNTLTQKQQLGHRGLIVLKSIYYYLNANFACTDGLYFARLAENLRLSLKSPRNLSYNYFNLTELWSASLPHDWETLSSIPVRLLFIRKEAQKTYLSVKKYDFEVFCIERP